MPIVAAVVVLAFVAGARLVPTYALVLYLTVIAGLTWVLWSFTELELPFVQDEGVNPIVRLSASLVIASACIVPLLLDAAWTGVDRRRRRWRMTRLAPWLIVAAVLIAYPVATLAAGGADFPTREECVQPATEDGDIDAVFGYFDSEADAAEMRDRALEVGFQGTEFEMNACGRVRVAVGGIPTLAVGREFVEQAKAAGST